MQATHKPTCCSSILTHSTSALVTPFLPKGTCGEIRGHPTQGSSAPAEDFVPLYVPTIMRGRPSWIARAAHEVCDAVDHSATRARCMHPRCNKLDAQPAPVSRIGGRHKARATISRKETKPGRVMGKGKK